MRMILCVVAPLFLVLGSTPALTAQNLRTFKDQVQRFLNSSSHRSELVTLGFKELDGGGREGWLSGNTTSQYQPSIYQLSAGYVYAFYGACDEDCDDLDFALYGPDGEFLVDDDKPDDDPLVMFLVRRSGTYTLRATIPSCDSGEAGCYYGVRAYFK